MKKGTSRAVGKPVSQIKALGGPYDGHVFALHSPCTAVFRVGGWCGRYNSQGRWEQQ